MDSIRTKRVKRPKSSKSRRKEQTDSTLCNLHQIRTMMISVHKPVNRNQALVAGSMSLQVVSLKERDRVLLMTREVWTHRAWQVPRSWVFMRVCKWCTRWSRTSRTKRTWKVRKRRRRLMTVVKLYSTLGHWIRTTWRTRRRKAACL